MAVHEHIISASSYTPIQYFDQRQHSIILHQDWYYQMGKEFHMMGDYHRSGTGSSLSGVGQKAAVEQKAQIFQKGVLALKGWRDN